MRMHYGIAGLLRKADYEPVLMQASFDSGVYKAVERTFRFALPFSGMLRGIRWTRQVEESNVEVTLKIGEDDPPVFDMVPAEVISITPSRILVAKDERIELVCRHTTMSPIRIGGMLTIDLDDQDN